MQYVPFQGPSWVPSQSFFPTFPFANSSCLHITNTLGFFPQDISPLLASTFEDLYTRDVIGADMETNWIKSRGGDDVYRESFSEELQKLLAEYKCRLTETDIVEENIIWAQDRAKTEEERALNMLEADAGEDFHKIGLPPVASSFRWIVDNELLRKNCLTCPDDYITDKLPVTRAPKGKSEPGYIKETFSFEQRVSAGSWYQMPAEIAHLQKISGSLPNVFLCTLTLPSTPDSSHQTKKTSKVHFTDLFVLVCQNCRNYMKNPRFFPPNALHGGKSLVISQEKVEQTIAGRKAEDNKGYALWEVLIFLIPCIFFFQGKFPGKGGMIAPGMTCQYTVQFIPEYLGDYEDCILVETQVSEPLLIPVQAKRAPPVLTLPHIIDCGSCLVGRKKVTMILCRNEGIGTGKFCIMPKKAWPPPNFRDVDIVDFVIQDPFAIHPAVFELAPGQSTTVEVSTNCYRKYLYFTKYIRVGQLIALELLFVTGGESKPEPGEVTDVTAQHLIRFDPQNPHTTEEKKLIIRNSIHTELPFYWQIIKPNLKPLIPEETADFMKLKYSQDTESAFSLNPEQGVLLPHANHEFILTYTPQEVCLVSKQ
uniref:DLEC1 cilia and flagella associated protein n=1 Tax=Strix occidentalis caurina TaxID=311401 RepID=A0A8D0KZZ9_STROC